MYIHERDNWTNFRWDTSQVSLLQEKVFRKQGLLYGRLSSLGLQHRLQDENNSEQKSVVINTNKMYLWETTGLVWGKDGFCGNFFGATMKPKHPSGGSSGSPIYDGNIVYGILHNGGEDFCGFYSSTHALKLLRQHLSK